MANYEKTQYGKEGFQFGDNIAESGTVTASAEVAIGTVLVRDSAKNWVPADSSTMVAGAGLGLAVEVVAQGSAVPASIGVAGRFNRNYIKCDGTAITDAQADLLRGQGMVALTVNKIDK